MSLWTLIPKIKAADNKKPILVAAGERDHRFPPPVMEMAAKSVGGPVELQIFKDGKHQLMLFYTSAFSDAVETFCVRHI